MTHYVRCTTMRMLVWKITRHNDCFSDPLVFFGVSTGCAEKLLRVAATFAGYHAAKFDFAEGGFQDARSRFVDAFSVTAKDVKLSLSSRRFLATLLVPIAIRFLILTTCFLVQLPRLLSSTLFNPQTLIVSM